MQQPNHPILTTMSEQHLAQQYARLLGNIYITLARNNLDQSLLIQLLQNNQHAELHRDDAIRPHSRNSFISSNQSMHTTMLFNPHFTEIIELPNGQFISPYTVFFHIVIYVYPVANHTDTFVINAHPKSPEGRPCLLECGQIAVIHPNYTIAWQLDSFEEQQNIIVYTAYDCLSDSTHYFIIRHDWSGDSSYFEEGESSEEEDITIED
jgi:hypothetical protein